jgi:hypothetical protein
MSPAHLNSACYNSDGSILVTLFHQGKGIIIDKASGEIRDVVSGLVNPHKLAKRKGGGYFISDTRRGKLVLADEEFRVVREIALAAMREDYARQTEANVYTLLNGTSGAGGTITTGFVPSGAQASTTATGTDSQTLVKHVRDRLAAYPFARFNSPTIGLMGANATSKFAVAVDTTQRPLLPGIAPANAFGNGNPITQGWSVDSLPLIPAWAMTGVAAGDSQIFILNRADCWVWESPTLVFRFEEKSGPHLIELALFGYFATHLLRPVGLSGIRIT